MYLLFSYLFQYHLLAYLQLSLGHTFEAIFPLFLLKYHLVPSELITEVLLASHQCMAPGGCQELEVLALLKCSLKVLKRKIIIGQAILYSTQIKIILLCVDGIHGPRLMIFVVNTQGDLIIGYRAIFMYISK